MSSTPMKQYFQLVPGKLKTFFKKYPPGLKYSDKPTLTNAADANPFLANKHPVTGRHHNPKYSLRRMSDLYKVAHEYGIQELLPPRNKLFFQEKYDQKKFMKGVLLPKGHKHELAQSEKMRKMKAAIKNADDYIVEVRGRKYMKKLEKRKQDKIPRWF
ncbi:LANO_0A03994g1_1 [Lachancea nothofagi CBS 11611]|uniref:LANO_0A03994g1_1 n=1 Tax=Lachancea nothofagi CBS 11611 TaxID=1266666 RepID=A0A1G4IPW6_9SACH|nr:LANO_0A03994g1_1 [Lachancea nothofagi CBS 11611]